MRALLLPGLLACAPPAQPVQAPLALQAGQQTLPLSSAVAADSTRADDLAAARALFERNVAAIQLRNREGYLACYEASEHLVRVGSTGPAFGYPEFERSVTGDWPVQLIARDVKLHWLGPGLVWGSYRYRVIEAAGLAREGLSERLFRRGEDGWRIVVTSAFEQPAGTPAPPCALVGATVYDGSEAPPIRDAVIVVREGRIAAIGPRASTEIPADVESIDLNGRFLVPGLIDTHVHYSQTGWADGRPDAWDVRSEHPYAEVQATLQAQPERFHRAFLHSGVTAVFDVGGYPWTRHLGATTELSPDAPHLRAAGPLLTTWDPGPAVNLPDQQQFVLLRDEAGARAAVASHAAQGSAAIKLWFIVRDPATLPELGRLAAAAGAAAREHGLPFIVHATGLAEARLAVEAGATLLVHSVEDQAVDEAFITACRERGVFYCPTLTVHRGYELLFERRLDETLGNQLLAVDSSVRQLVQSTAQLPVDPRDTPAERARRAERGERRQALMAANLSRLHAGGVRVVLGTDAGNPLTLHGPSVFPELEAMQAAGLAPRAVLTAATRDAALAMGRGEDLGLLAPGRVADLLVLVRDPALDIAGLRSLNLVMRAGVLQQRGRLAGR
ncbi:MAG: amidohydrolase family protein [Planctomycetota bacterium]